MTNQTNPSEVVPKKKRKRPNPETRGIGQGKTNLTGERGKSPVLNVRLPEVLIDKLDHDAESHGLKRSDWVRQMIQEAKPGNHPVSPKK